MNCSSRKRLITIFDPRNQLVTWAFVSLRMNTPREALMRIGILGSGKMAAALAPKWLAAGHELFIGGRNTTHVAQLADSLNVEGGTLRDAALFGEVCLLAVRSEGLEQTLISAGALDGSLAGKVIIDCGNAVFLNDFSQVTWNGRSLAEQVSFLASTPHVAKAFNQCHADVWSTDSKTLQNKRVVVPYCGSGKAKEVALSLIESVGAAGLDVGDLSQSRHVEAMAIMVIRQLFSGAPSSARFAWTTD